LWSDARDGSKLINNSAAVLKTECDERISVTLKVKIGGETLDKQ
jgi:hypothetical protein